MLYRTVSWQPMPISIDYFFFFVFRSASAEVSAPALVAWNGVAGHEYIPSFVFFFGAPFPLALSLEALSDCGPRTATTGLLTLQGARVDPPSPHQTPEARTP